MLKNSTTYILQGLNFKKFLSELSKNKIEVTHLKRLDYNLFEIGCNNKQQKLFLQIVNKFNYVIKIKTLSTKQFIKKIAKTNFVFVIIGLILCVNLIFLSNFVINIEIIGQENVPQQLILETLQQNGFEKYKLKSKYNLNNVEKLLTSKIDKISYASAIIKGNTLIVNVNEKIDNSEFIYDYSPIVAPFDCIIKKIELVSGSVVKGVGQTVKKGETIIEPYKFFGQTQVKVPAKGKIEAYTEFCQDFFATLDISQKDKDFLIEEYKKKVYNELSSFDGLENLTLNVLELPEQNRLIIRVTLAGNITF